MTAQLQRKEKKDGKKESEEKSSEEIQKEIREEEKKIRRPKNKAPRSFRVSRIENGGFLFTVLS
jgi:hypothetical protein